VTRLRQLTEVRTAQLNQQRLVADPAIRKGFGEMLGFLAQQIEELKQAIAALIEQDPLWRELNHAFRTIKGVADRTVARIMAEMPEIGTLSGKTISRLAGLAPLANDSGKHRRGAQAARPPQRKSQTGTTVRQRACTAGSPRPATQLKQDCCKVKPRLLSGLFLTRNKMQVQQNKEIPRDARFIPCGSATLVLDSRKDHFARCTPWHVYPVFALAAAVAGVVGKRKTAPSFSEAQCAVFSINPPLTIQTVAERSLARVCARRSRRICFSVPCALCPALYLLTTITSNVPGTTLGLGLGFSGVAAGRGPKSAVTTYTLPVSESSAIVRAPAFVVTFCSTE
jgi:hypothetical protein